MSAAVQVGLEGVQDAGAPVACHGEHVVDGLGADEAAYGSAGQAESFCQPFPTLQVRLSAGHRRERRQRCFAAVTGGYTEHRSTYQSGLLPRPGPAGYQESRRDRLLHQRHATVTHHAGHAIHRP